MKRVNERDGFPLLSVHQSWLVWLFVLSHATWLVAALYQLHEN